MPGRSPEDCPPVRTMAEAQLPRYVTRIDFAARGAVRGPTLTVASFDPVPGAVLAPGIWDQSIGWIGQIAVRPADRSSGGLEAILEPTPEGQRGYPSGYRFEGSDRTPFIDCD